MQSLKLFYLENCPYCKNAKRAVAALTQENAKYAEIPIEWIEESQNATLAEQFDYYYVPTVFMNGRKLYECSPSEGYEEIRDQIKGAFDAALQ
ncbi:MAG: glutaredoxin [Clostridia bacterium]|nr:glutaredoxin [Clostridia bacterium]